MLPSFTTVTQLLLSGIFVHIFLYFQNVTTGPNLRKTKHLPACFVLWKYIMVLVRWCYVCHITHPYSKISIILQQTGLRMTGQKAQKQVDKVGMRKFFWKELQPNVQFMVQLFVCFLILYSLRSGSSYKRQRPWSESKTFQSLKGIYLNRRRHIPTNNG